MRIAECEKRSNAFYKGEIAEKIDAFFRANGGYLRRPRVRISGSR
jgi:gamma-glutamyltranspeptidase